MSDKPMSEWVNEFEAVRLAPAEGTGRYHLRIVGYEIGTWDDGRTRVDLSTNVVCGPSQGLYGPRITLTQPQEFILGDGRKISEEAARRTLARQIMILGGSMKIPERIERDVRTGAVDELVLEEIGGYLKGHTFIGDIQQDGKADSEGIPYDKMVKKYPFITLPDLRGGARPEGFTCQCPTFKV